MTSNFSIIICQENIESLSHLTSWQTCDFSLWNGYTSAKKLEEYKTVCFFSVHNTLSISNFVCTQEGTYLSTAMWACNLRMSKLAGCGDIPNFL